MKPSSSIVNDPLRVYCVSPESGDTTVKAKLNQPMKSITHIGYCLKGTVADFSPIEVAEAR